MGIEPMTYCLASNRSTPELHPQNSRSYRSSLYELGPFPLVALEAATNCHTAGILVRGRGLEPLTFCV